MGNWEIMQWDREPFFVETNCGFFAVALPAYDFSSGDSFFSTATLVMSFVFGGCMKHGEKDMS